MLEIKNIWKTFNAGTVNEKQALRGVSLTLKDGDGVLGLDVRQAFNVEDVEDVVFLPKIMSRKKQVIPMLSALWG